MPHLLSLFGLATSRLSQPPAPLNLPVCSPACAPACRRARRRRHGPPRRPCAARWCWRPGRPPPPPRGRPPPRCGAAWCCRTTRTTEGSRRREQRVGRADRRGREPGEEGHGEDEVGVLQGSRLGGAGACITTGRTRTMRMRAWVRGSAGARPREDVRGSGVRRCGDTIAAARCKQALKANLRSAPWRRRTTASSPA